MLLVALTNTFIVSANIMVIPASRGSINAAGRQPLLALNDYQFQVRDEYRTDFDSGRGGYGLIVKQKLEINEHFV